MVSQEIINAPINAAARIIGDISTGIYRSPANALKELVSNAFDAGATEVVINTDYPGFSSVSCYDNGPGISLDRLTEIFKYIGGSNKKLGGEGGPLGRPLIGHIGIGILAMSQLSKRFVIISTTSGEPYRIEAEININEFETPASTRTNLGGGTIGNVAISVIPEPVGEHYTIVTTPYETASLRRNLGQGVTPRSHFASVDREAETFEEWVRGTSLMEGPKNLTEYEAFLWELAALCPVRYFDDGPVLGWDGWDHVKERLNKYDFNVTVDGYELRKPVLLPSSSEPAAIGDDFKVYPFRPYRSSEQTLKFEGYVFHQRTQILPPNLRGLLIRIRDVGIRGYDPSWLNYPVNLGPMMSAMSGEIHVSKGLEEALNIDRNSFNETHEHFQQVQEVVFGHLGLPNQAGIARDIRARSRSRQQAVRQDQVRQHLEGITEKLARLTRSPWRIEVDPFIDSPILVDPLESVVSVNFDHTTVPTGVAARKEFFRVCLTSRLAECLDPPVGNDALVGWLRTL